MWFQEVKLMFPGAQRMNRGNHEIPALVRACKANSVTDLVIVHETRGQPGMLPSCTLHFLHVGAVKGLCSSVCTSSASSSAKAASDHFVLLARVAIAHVCPQLSTSTLGQHYRNVTTPNVKRFLLRCFKIPDLSSDHNNCLSHHTWCLSCFFILFLYICRWPGSVPLAIWPNGLFHSLQRGNEARCSRHRHHVRGLPPPHFSQLHVTARQKGERASAGAHMPLIFFFTTWLCVELINSYSRRYPISSSIFFQCQRRTAGVWSHLPIKRTSSPSGRPQSTAAGKKTHKHNAVYDKEYDFCLCLTDITPIRKQTTRT